MTLKTTSTVLTTTAWVKFVFIGSILRPAQRMESMKPPALRSTSINHRMPLPSRASQRRRQWKNLFVIRRSSLCNSSPLRHSLYSHSLYSRNLYSRNLYSRNLCNSLHSQCISHSLFSSRSRYNNRSRSLNRLRHSPLRVLSQSRSQSQNRLLKSRSVKKR
ncbi:hypothetical protein L416_03431 [Enterobacter hormaechei]|nr:hypothetical protein L416_03431 [Enterobacter hormaechei]KLW68887.1 hypothetical protein SK57_00191 [Enterobacter sp. BIDMC87]SAG74185.1 Uncharacterised protein [Enterobacter hormaechei]